MSLPGEDRPWGYFQIIHQNDKTWTKMLYINPGHSLSLQFHHYRTEYWVALDECVRAVIGGETLDLTPEVRYTVPRETTHRLINTSPHEQVRVLEVAVGHPLETDIVRLSDRYGRQS